MRKVSVIMSTFNRAAMLPRAVDSFLNQAGGVDAELIILNNGSTDFTDQYLATLRDHKQIRMFKSSENRKDAGNYLWSKAKGEYVCVLCDDDELTADSLIDRVAYMDRESAEVCYTSVIIQDAAGKKIKSVPVQPVNTDRIINDEYINFTTMMWHRNVNKKFVFDTDLFYYQDWFFKIRCLQECKVIAIASETMRYTIHAGQESQRLRGTGGRDNEIMRRKIKELYNK